MSNYILQIFKYVHLNNYRNTLLQHFVKYALIG